MVTKTIQLKIKHNPEVNIRMTNSNHQTISLALITAIVTTTIRHLALRNQSNHMVTMIIMMIIQINSSNTAEETRATSMIKIMEEAINRNKQVEIQFSVKESNLEATQVQLLISHLLECMPHQVENQPFNCFENLQFVKLCDNRFKIY